MLYKACFADRPQRDWDLPGGCDGGDILLIDSIRLDPKYRGYGIGLVAVDKLIMHVQRARFTFDARLVAVSLAGVGSDLKSGMRNDGEAQKKLSQYW